jgi:hypothetical protein
MTDAVEKVGGTAPARNNRIQGDDFLNRSCAVSGRLESMLLGDPPNLFSTVSTQSGHRQRKIAACNVTTEPHFAGRKSLL